MTTDHPADLEALVHVSSVRPMPPMAIRAPGGGKWHLPFPNTKLAVFGTDQTDCGRPWARMSERTPSAEVPRDDRCRTCWYGRFGNKRWAS